MPRVIRLMRELREDPRSLLLCHQGAGETSTAARFSSTNTRTTPRLRSVRGRWRVTCAQKSASLLAQQGVPVTAAAASLGDDHAISLRAYAHLFPVICGPSPTQWTWRGREFRIRNGRDLYSWMLRGETGGRMSDPGHGFPNHLTWTFESGCRDLNPGPLDPQSSALTKLRHSPCAIRPVQRVREANSYPSAPMRANRKEPPRQPPLVDRNGTKPASTPMWETSWAARESFASPLVSPKGALGRRSREISPSQSSSGNRTQSDEWTGRTPDGVRISHNPIADPVQRPATAV